MKKGKEGMRGVEIFCERSVVWIIEVGMEGRSGEAERGGRCGERTREMERFCERVLYGEMRWG